MQLKVVKENLYLDVEIIRGIDIVSYLTKESYAHLRVLGLE